MSRRCGSARRPTPACSPCRRRSPSATPSPSASSTPTTRCSSTATPPPARSARARRPRRPCSQSAGVDVDAVWAEVDSGRPLATVEKEHTAFVDSHTCGASRRSSSTTRAVFVRLLDLPEGDAAWPSRRSSGSSTRSPGRSSTSSSTRRSPADRRGGRDRTDRRCAEHRCGERRPEDDRRRGPDVAAREGPVPLVDVRHGLGARPPARLRRACGPGWSGRPWAVPRLRWRVQPAPVNLSAPMWVDDPDFDIDYHVRRIALPKPGTMRQLLDLAHADRRRPVRPHPAAVAVRRHRGPARRQGGAGAEDAPHDHRRRGRRADVAAVPRLRARRAADRRPSTRARSTSSRPPPPPSAAETRPRPARRRLPAAARRRPPGAASCSPTRRRSRPRARRPSTRSAASCRSSPTSSGRARRCGRERSLRRRARGRAGAVPRRPRTPPSASAARSTRRSSPPPPRRPARYHVELGAPVEHLRTSMAVSTRTTAVRRQRVLARPDAGADRRDADRRAVPR